jgi:hypothetical protein
MTIQLELNPEFVERLSTGAKARGIGLEEYAEILLREAVGNRTEPLGILSVEDLRAMLEAVAKGSDRLPKVASSAFTRESYYEERR